MPGRPQKPFRLPAGLLAALLVLGSSVPAMAQLAGPGDLLVADAGADAVFVVDLVTGEQSPLASGSPLSDPSGMAVDPTTGLIYVTDRSGGPGGIGALIEIDPADGSMVVVASGDQLALPEDVIVRGNNSGQITVIDGLSGLVVVDPDSGDQTVDVAQIGSAITRLALFGAPRAADAIVIDPVPLEIQRILSSNGSTLLVGKGGAMQLPTGITTRGPFADFAMVCDAGGVSGLDGQVIEIRVTAFSEQNPGANQRIVASGVNLADPLDIVTDPSGVFLYVVDPSAAAGAGAVIRVDAESGDQVVLSSGGSFVDPSAIEFFPQVTSDRIRPSLYVADDVSASIIGVDPGSGVQSPISSGDLLVEPSHVVAVPGGPDLFVTDRRSGALGAVVHIDVTNGTQSLVTENGDLSEPEALIQLPDGDLLVADRFAPALVRVDPASGGQSVVAGAPSDLIALARTGDGTVYGLHASASEIVSIDLDGSGTQVVGSGGDLGAAVDIAAETAGTLVVAAADGKVIRVDPSLYDNGNPPFNQTLLSSGDELVAPTGIGVAPDGELYVTDPLAASGAGAVVQVSPLNGAQSIQSPGGGVGVFMPEAITSGRPRPGPGDIVVADPNRDSIVMIDPASGDQSIITRRGRLAFPDGIALDLDGTLLVAEANNNELLRVDLATGQQTLVAKGQDLPDPRAVVVAPNGDIFVGSRTAPYPIARITPGTGATTIIGINGQAQNPPTAEARFTGLQKLLYDAASGQLLFTTDVVGLNVSGDGLLEIDPAEIPLPATPSELITGAPLAFANEMVLDPSTGDVFVANGQDILRVDRGQQSASIVSAGGFFDRAQGLAMDAQGYLLTTSIFGDSVVRVDPVTGEQELITYGNQLGQPQGIVVIPAPEPGVGVLGLFALMTVAVISRHERRGNRARIP